MQDAQNENNEQMTTTDAEAVTTVTMPETTTEITDPAAKVEDVVPEEYADFTLPEGAEADPVVFGEAKTLFKELGLTQEKGQKVVDLYAAKILPGIEAKRIEQWEDIRKGWREEVKGNKEITLDESGQNLEGLRVINTLFKPDEAKAVREELDRYGLGDNPKINLLLARMAAHLKEDTIEGKGNTATQTKSIAERMFPNLPVK